MGKGPNLKVVYVKHVCVVADTNKKRKLLFYTDKRKIAMSDSTKQLQFIYFFFLQNDHANGYRPYRTLNMYQLFPIFLNPNVHIYKFLRVFSPPTIIQGFNRTPMGHSPFQHVHANQLLFQRVLQGVDNFVQHRLACFST